MMVKIILTNSKLYDFFEGGIIVTNIESYISEPKIADIITNNYNIDLSQLININQDIRWILWLSNSINHFINKVTDVFPHLSL